MSQGTELYDPIIGFGKYKDQGMRLSEIPVDYLAWLTTPTDSGEPFTFKGENWCELAKSEIHRRKEGLPIPTAKPLPIEPEEVDLSKPVKDPKIRARTERIWLTFDAVDNAAELLLKDFITRPEKSETFCLWLSNYAKEAAQYGDLKGIDAVNPQVDILMYVYRGVVLDIRVAKSKLTLQRVGRG